MFCVLCWWHHCLVRVQWKILYWCLHFLFSHVLYRVFFISINGIYKRLVSCCNQLIDWLIDWQTRGVVVELIVWSLAVAVCTCAVRNCLECRYRQQCANVTASVQPAVGDHLSPIQALIAGVQAPARPSEPVAEQVSVISVYVFRRDLLDSVR